MLNSADYYRFSDLYPVCLKTIDHLSFKLRIFSGHILIFKIRVLKVQDFGNFELHPCISEIVNFLLHILLLTKNCLLAIERRFC